MTVRKAPPTQMPEQSNKDLRNLHYLKASLFKKLAKLTRNFLKSFLLPIDLKQKTDYDNKIADF